MNDLNVLKSMLSGIKIERNMLIRRTNKTEDDKNDLEIDELQIKALEAAISALSADGEYIKKSDILNELGDVNMDILTDEVKEIVNGLPSYSFPDSENKGDLISKQAVLDGIAEWIVNGYADSEADCSHISSLVTHLPSVENKGEWIADIDKWGDVVTTVNGYTCSKCGTFNSDKDNFCPNCGADMRGKT